jgi:hypothetical protein
VLQDLVRAPADEVAAERARVEHEGWGARLLAAEDADGLWAGGACFPAGYRGGGPGQPWTATMHTLQTLQLLGLDPASESARRAIDLIAENGRWEHEGQRYFDGEVEPCINGRTVETGAYFGVDVAPIVERLLTEGLADGGWNCEAENGSVRSSFDTTINVLDGLLEFERTTGGSAEVRGARRRGEQYLLERTLFRRKSTGAVVQPQYLEFAFPYYWHYDVLRALDYFRRSDSGPDPRMTEAVDLVRSKQQPDGCSITSTPVTSTSTSKDPWASPAGGTPFARYGCSSGGTGRPEAEPGRRPRTAARPRPAFVLVRASRARREIR